MNYLNVPCNGNTTCGAVDSLHNDIADLKYTIDEQRDHIHVLTSKIDKAIEYLGERAILSEEEIIKLAVMLEA
jgi:RNA binding exosome subunit